MATQTSTQKAAIVTGATSGIGKATAITLAKASYALTVSGRSRERGEALISELNDLDANAQLLIGDVRDEDFCAELVKGTLSRFGRLDLLVNGAGVIFHRSLLETSDAEWRETIDSNVDSVFFASKAAIGAMKERGGGVIVNVASDASLVGAVGLSAYCASKGAVLLMTKAMALDHGRDGIRVVAVCPDQVDTPMLRGEAKQLGQEYEAFVADCAAGLPVGRIAQPEEIAEAIAYLASDKAGFMTGTGLVMDGGYTAS